MSYFVFAIYAGTIAIFFGQWQHNLFAGLFCFCVTFIWLLKLNREAQQ